jgi:hypothetical protein
MNVRDEWVVVASAGGGSVGGVLPDGRGWAGEEYEARDGHVRGS